MRRFQTLSAKGSSALPSAGNWLMGRGRGGGTIFFFFFVSVGGFSSVAENMRHFKTGALLSSSVVAWRRSAVARSPRVFGPQFVLVAVLGEAPAAEKRRRCAPQVGVVVPGARRGRRAPRA